MLQEPISPLRNRSSKFIKSKDFCRFIGYLTLHIDNYFSFFFMLNVINLIYKLQEKRTKLFLLGTKMVTLVCLKPMIMNLEYFILECLQVQKYEIVEIC